MKTASMTAGALRFGLASVLAFSVWAFGGRLSEPVLYSAITTVFLGLAGFLLHPLLDGPNQLRRCYALFVPGFLLYALLWCAGWFGLGGHEGEILGSASGLAAFTWLATRRLGHADRFLPAFAVLFLGHTLGYVIGGLCYYSTGGRGVLAPVLEGQRTLGRLLWGLFYGLGFGAGIGYVLAVAQGGPRKNPGA